MKKMSKLRSLYAYLLLFVMSLTLTIVVVLIVSAMTIFSPNVFVKNVAYVNYDGRSAEMAKQEAVEIGLLYGVDQEVFDSLDFVRYAKKVAYITYPDSVAEKVAVESALFEKDVTNALQDYALAQGLSLTQEVLFGIDEMTFEVVEAFKTAVSIPLHQSFFLLIETFDKLYFPALIILLIILLIQQQILYRLDRRNHSRNLAYTFVMSGWMMILAPSAVWIIDVYRRIMIYPDYFRDLLSRHFEVTLWGAMIAGGVLLIIGCVWFVLYLRKSKPIL